MNCPNCGKRGKCTDSRPIAGENATRRRYICVDGHKFSSGEVPLPVGKNSDGGRTTITEMIGNGMIADMRTKLFERLHALLLEVEATEKNRSAVKRLAQRSK